jgi:sacsin
LVLLDVLKLNKNFLCEQVPSLREQSGKVSAVELVQAVNEILSAAGINMDAEKQALLQKTIDLQDNLKESQAALLLEQVGDL